jgi:hypothetical protein
MTTRQPMPTKPTAADLFEMVRAAGYTPMKWVNEEPGEISTCSVEVCPSSYGHSRVDVWWRNGILSLQVNN